MDIGLVTPLRRASKVIITARVSDKLAAEIERVSAAYGQSRSAWVVNVVARAALATENDRLPTPAIAEGGSDDQVRVTLRLSRSEIDAIERIGASLRLSRTEWIKRVLRWQLWDDAGCLRLAPTTQSELGKLRKQLIAIGRNINQAVQAMNATNWLEGSSEISCIAPLFLETCSDLRLLLLETRRSLAYYVGGEVGYWTGAFTRERP